MLILESIEFYPIDILKYIWNGGKNQKKKANDNRKWFYILF